MNNERGTRLGYQNVRYPTHGEHDAEVVNSKGDVVHRCKVLVTREGVELLEPFRMEAGKAFSLRVAGWTFGLSAGE